MSWLPSREHFAPLTVAEIELSGSPKVSYPAGAVAEQDGDQARRAEGASRQAQRGLVLVRLHGEPVGTMVIDAPGGLLDTRSCAMAAWESLGASLDTHLSGDALPRRPPVPKEPGGALPRCREDAAEVQTSGPAITVVVATRDRTHQLEACLDSLARLDYPRFEVLVVDNDPQSDATALMVRRRAEPHVRYAWESRRGLAAAHNRGLQLAEGTIVAFTDDDVIVDKHWLTEVARAFRAGADVACVTGLIMPAELQTRVQIMLEAHGHFSKGYEQRLVDSGARRPSDPLFPFTAGRLGSGANMSFDRDCLRELSGFDPAIGAGTVARGGDDLAAFFAVLAAGHSLVYQPGALVWHRHRRDAASLTDQAYGYGVGLGAYVASVLTHHPAVIGQALRRAPAGLAYALHPGSPRNADLRGLWPRQLVRLERRGMVFGPLAYGISRWRTRGQRRPYSAAEPVL